MISFIARYLQCENIIFVEIENRPAPLSFVILHVLTQIYYFCTENLAAANYSANLRFVEPGRFLTGEKELSDSFGKACYVFRNSDKWDAESVPEEILGDEVARELTRACEVANFPPDVKLNFVRNQSFRHPIGTT